MLLTISTTHQPAIDLGFLLHKHPDKLQTKQFGFGQAHIFYPEATEELCTMALLLEVDPVHLVREREKHLALDQYVNDRPYVASSFLSVALAQLFSTAMRGTCEMRPSLAQTPLPLTVHIPVFPSAGGVEWFEHLFGPLGYSLKIEPLQLDETYPEWGMSTYYSVTLSHTCILRDLLSHLYVLIPVLDGNKHYWLDTQEIEKLLRHGQGWLPTHPYYQQIIQRYLQHKSSLVKEAIARLVQEESFESENTLSGASTLSVQTDTEGLEEKPAINFHQQRLEAVRDVLKQSEVHSVLDLGCGEGKLLSLLLKEKQFERLLGMDVSYRSLEIAQKRLHLDQLSPRASDRLHLIHGSLIYQDQRLQGYEAAAVVEVIEHLDLPRLQAFERAIFEFARPGLVVITTPNAEYNQKFPQREAGHFRHHDHRFEWTRQEFQQWASGVAERHSYTFEFRAIGEDDALLGSLTQMGIFRSQG